MGRLDRSVGATTDNSTAGRTKTDIPVKLDLLREQASRDNRNRTFIPVGDEPQANKESATTNSRPMLGQTKKLQRSQSFTELVKSIDGETEKLTTSGALCVNER